MDNSKPREQLLEIYAAALSAVNGETVVKQYLEELDLDSKQDYYVLATGKAAAAMMQGAYQAMADKKISIQAALLITKYDHLNIQPQENLESVEAGHPIPDANSLIAGEKVVEFVNQIPKDAHLIALVSGGSSALVEKLKNGINLEQLLELNKQLYTAGISIDVMNVIRQKISSVKNGRLLRQINCETLTVLYLSDVPKDDIHVIGSGMFAEEIIYDEIDSDVNLPAWYIEINNSSVGLDVNFDLGKPKQLKQVVLANLTQAKQAAAKYARSLGYEVTVIDSLITADYLEFKKMLLTQLSLKTNHILIAGGEVTIKLPANPGEGGRCQSLALATAIEIDNRKGFFFLAAGTDGSDGPSFETGAIVDYESIIRAKLSEYHQLNAQESLKQANANDFLAASGDLILTGPTGTNVMDLYIGLNCN